MFKRHNKCRACGSNKLIQVFDLGLQPLANAFAHADDWQAGYYPLEVLMCPKCRLAQLSVVVPPSVLYQNYAYVTSKATALQDHFRMLWSDINKECKPDSVVEVGSNDGAFLEFAKANGADAVCGIDPAENLAEIAEERGIHTFRGVLDDQSAQMALASMPPVSLVVARHVFCHVDDWRKFVRSMEMLGGKDTLVVIEVPYVMDMMENVQFDTIYHEHLSYLNLYALECLLDESQFQIHKVLHYPVHGGSVVVMLRRKTSGLAPDDSVRRLIGLELETLTSERWIEFKDQADLQVRTVRDFVFYHRRSGHSIAGYGASAKSTVWVNACGFKRQQVDFICDNTPQKIGKCSPGSDIPIVEESELINKQPNYAILFAWNWRNQIVPQNELWRSKGGRFLIPSPHIEFV